MTEFAPWRRLLFRLSQRRRVRRRIPALLNATCRLTGSSIGLRNLAVALT